MRHLNQFQKFHEHVLRSTSVHSSANGHTLRLRSLHIPAPYSTRAIESIFRERPRKRLLAADFLAPDKAVHSDGNGAVDIAAATVFAQTHFSEGLAYAEDRFEMADLKRKVRAGSKKN